MGHLLAGGLNYIYVYIRLRRSFAALKGPKQEKLVAGIFTQIRPVWRGELEASLKNF